MEFHPILYSVERREGQRFGAMIYSVQAELDRLPSCSELSTNIDCQFSTSIANIAPSHPKEGTRSTYNEYMCCFTWKTSYSTSVLNGKCFIVASKFGHARTAKPLCPSTALATIAAMATAPALPSSQRTAWVVSAKQHRKVNHGRSSTT